MPVDHTAYQQRDRADSFGTVADDYDRYRPSYPAALVDDLVALRPGTVLDIGCGTGKAARGLAARGLTVLGVEPDARMAAVATRAGLRVEVAGFEAWDPRARRFDLITCGQAWHWIDPSLGAPKAAQLLTAGGTLALFWNYGAVSDEVRALTDPVYDRYAPELRDPPGADKQQEDLGPYIADLKQYGGFDRVSSRVYHWERIESVTDLVARIGTHSDHLLLGTTRLAELQHGLREALGGLGDTVRGTGSTYAVVAGNDD
jgi:SAM-dependent methyltransferase